MRATPTAQRTYLLRCGAGHIEVSNIRHVDALQTDETVWLETGEPLPYTPHQYPAQMFGRLEVEE